MALTTEMVSGRVAMSTMLTRVEMTATARMRASNNWSTATNLSMTAL
jgi:hypothetical protein